MTTITSISPSEGPINGGNLITLTFSSQFTSLSSNSLQIWFGDTQISNIIYYFNKDLNVHIVIFTAPLSTSGVKTVNVSIETPDGISSPVNYTYTNTNNLPFVKSISPNSGSNNTQVTVKGDGFFGSFYVNNPINGFSNNNNNFNSNANNTFQNVVTSLTINGQTIPYQSNNDSYNFIVVNSSQINILNMPFMANGTYNIIVNTLYGSTSCSNNTKFTYNNPQMQITNVNPCKGSSDGGEKIIISGINFSKYYNILNSTNNNEINQNSLTVLFGDYPASYIFNNDIIATLPPNIFRKKHVNITIINNFCKVTFPFEYYDVVPKIKSVELCSENILKIKGKHFLNVQSVFVGSNEAKILSFKKTKQIKVRLFQPIVEGDEIIINRQNVNTSLINSHNNLDSISFNNIIFSSKSFIYHI
jgi:hypothetical protein